MKLKPIFASFAFLLLIPNILQAQAIESAIAKKDAPLFAFVGKYGNAKFLNNPIVWKAVSSVVPKNLQKMIEPRLSVQPPIYYYDNFIITSGCLPHACGADEAQVWFNIDEKSAIVVLMIDGNTTIYSKDYEWQTLPLSLKARLGDIASIQVQPNYIKVVKTGR